MCNMEDNQAKDSITPSSADNGSKQKKASMKWNAFFGIFMVVIYFSMAYLTLFTEHFFWITDWARYGLGSIFALYGVWRGYRYLKA